MNLKVYDEAYEKRLSEYFDRMMPEKVYDAHFHISKEYANMSEYKGDPYTQYEEFMEKYIGRKIAGGLIMAAASSKHTPAQLDDENDYILSLAKREGLDVGLLMMPSYTKEKAEKMLEAYPEIKALKPYITYTTGSNMFESDLFEYAPEWMWEIANEREMPVIIHLSYYQNMLSDDRNIRDIRYVSKKYPKAKSFGIF